MRSIAWRSKVACFVTRNIAYPTSLIFCLCNVGLADRARGRGTSVNGLSKVVGPVRDQSRRTLLFHQAGVAGDALPLARIINPRIGEAPQVVVWLALIGAFGVVGSNHYRRVVV